MGHRLEVATVFGDVPVSSIHLWLPAILMLVLLALQTPITWSMAIAALGFFVLNLGEMPLANFAQQMAEGTESVSLLALPLFVLAGCIMNASGITRRLLNLAEETYPRDSALNYSVGASPMRGADGASRGGKGARCKPLHLG